MLGRPCVQKELSPLVRIGPFPPLLPLPHRHPEQNPRNHPNRSKFPPWNPGGPSQDLWTELPRRALTPDAQMSFAPGEEQGSTPPSGKNRGPLSPPQSKAPPRANRMRPPITTTCANKIVCSSVIGCLAVDAFMDLITPVLHLYRYSAGRLPGSPYGPFVLCQPYPSVEANCCPLAYWILGPIVGCACFW